ncbi:alpha/beta fold hydrolase [Ferrimonas lipolytica]|uniref:Alpha/beta hydrolase n=1 Tax=Ferrimonas lipolytica TaxID=2724191 RepID=A0A6H1UEB2_9GAMM|nr:alpha/beta hydrolase [Ferrimonas lipolytica]QIZ76969.1 alpha/beta hydrolase [Ferrimonas lipolytica]
MAGLIPELQAWQQQGQYFSWRNHQIFFGEQGQGPALVLIHGFPSASWDWQYLLPMLSQHYRVIYLDMLGFGFSDKPLQPYLIAHQADVIEALCQHLNVEQMHILAHDYGDTVAQELLARQLNKQHTISCLSCALLNGGLFPESHRPLLVQKLLGSSLGPIFGRFFRQQTLTKNLTRIWGDKQPTPLELLGIWQLLRFNNGERALPYIIRYMEERKQHRERWLFAIAETTIPFVLIDGVDDPISGQSLVNRFKTLIPEKTVCELQGVGHYPQLEAPQQVLTHLLPFLQHAQSYIEQADCNYTTGLDKQKAV